MFIRLVYRRRDEVKQTPSTPADYYIVKAMRAYMANRVRYDEKYFI